MSDERKKVVYKVFRGSGDMTWDRLLSATAEFVETLMPERIISISHSSDQGRGTVVVWYMEGAI